MTTSRHPTAQSAPSAELAGAAGRKVHDANCKALRSLAPGTIILYRDGMKDPFFAIVLGFSNNGQQVKLKPLLAGKLNYSQPKERGYITVQGIYPHKVVGHTEVLE